MASNQFLMRALPGVHRGPDVPVNYWTACAPEDIAPFLTDRFEVSRFLWDSMEEESTSAPDWDSADGMAWEIPLVQAWAQGLVITLTEDDLVSEYMGEGNEFTYIDILNEFPEFEPVSKAQPKESLDAKERTCPWCGVRAQKAYNVFQPDFATYSSERDDLSDPVLWTDGVWWEAGIDPDCQSDGYNQFGEHLIGCPACDAVFLTSAIEAVANTQTTFSGAQSWILPGKFAKAELSDNHVDGAFRQAHIDLCLDFLSRNLESEGLINWEQWTAAQQLVGWASYDSRRGDDLTPDQDQRGRSLLAQFCDRVGQIKEGTLGAMSPMWSAYSQDRDPDYFEYQYPLEESIPLANMFRIIGDFQQASRFAGLQFIDYENLEELENQNSFDEVELFKCQREWLLNRLIRNRDNRWAAASDQL